MNRTATTLAAACFAVLALSACAQAGPGERHRSMSPEQRAQMRENMKAARESCKNAADQRACMASAFCSKAPDPAKCQAMASERRAKFAQRMDERQKAHEACSGKRGDELARCLRDQPAFKDGPGGRRHHHRMKG